MKYLRLASMLILILVTLGCSPTGTVDLARDPLEDAGFKALDEGTVGTCEAPRQVQGQPFFPGGVSGTTGKSDLVIPTFEVVPADPDLHSLPQTGLPASKDVIAYTVPGEPGDRFQITLKATTTESYFFPNLFVSTACTVEGTEPQDYFLYYGSPPNGSADGALYAYGGTVLYIVVAAKDGRTDTQGKPITTGGPYKLSIFALPARACEGATEITFEAGETEVYAGGNLSAGTEGSIESSNYASTTKGQEHVFAVNLPAERSLSVETYVGDGDSTVLYVRDTCDGPDLIGNVNVDEDSHSSAVFVERIDTDRQLLVFVEQEAGDTASESLFYGIEFRLE